MTWLKYFCVSAIAFMLLLANNAQADDKIRLNEQFYQNGNFKIGMLNPVDEPFERYKPEEMHQKIFKHVSRIGNFELTALYLDYYRSPTAPSFWDEDAATRGAVLAAILATDIPMSEDFGFTKLNEVDKELEDYRQKDIRYGLLVEGEAYIYAFRFIRKGGDEYILVYKAPLAEEYRLTPDEFFGTFSLVR